MHGVLLAVGLALVPHTPAQSAYTEADLRAAVACENSDQPCAPAFLRQATDACMNLPQAQGQDAFADCLKAPMDDCYFTRRVDDGASNDRTIITCSLYMEAAIREAIDGWLVQAEVFAPPQAVQHYRAQRAEVRTKAQANAASNATGEVEAAGARQGVWLSFARFLWAQRARYPTG